MFLFTSHPVPGGDKLSSELCSCDTNLARCLSKNDGFYNESMRGIRSKNKRCKIN